MITGASGFIGRHLTHSIQKAQNPWQLRLVSRDVTRLRDSTGAAFHTVGDIDGRTDWSALLQNVDLVVHAAARVHMLNDTAASASMQYRRTNTEGTLRLAHQAAIAGVKRFIFISTVGIHGISQNHPFLETDNPAPQGPYAKSKLDAEYGLLNLASHSGMDVVVIRPPLVYGSDAPGNFSRLATIVRCGVPLPLGSIQNLRSLVAIDNLVDFIQHCMLHPAAANQDFLISDDKDISTPVLIQNMCAAMQKPVRLVPVPLIFLKCGAACLRKQDMLHQLTSTLQVNIHKARTLLKWKPKVTPIEGLYKALSPTLNL
ncbi:NAD-dependent epimerase/dehydratase family protein [Acidovorax sp.]|uniref:NAD-dependent epimerase/dehydratase family protein n=1 Tax=Acidovorax sp. TaxID=1872122 RepID=UPI002613FACF|nr:NAD-dependent epimerase/dehydratase family protein [Acidovorax sp.]